MKFNILIVVLVAGLAGCGNGLFYHPDQVEYLTPENAGQKYEDVYFPSLDGTRLHGWFVPASGKPKATIVHFHGNAQNLSAHYPLVAWLPRHGYNVFTFDYRGYGKSEGDPGREGIHQDARAALDYIASRKDTGSPDLIILGQSLGGAVAIVAAAEKKRNIKAIVIESTFSSYRNIAGEKARAIPGSGPVLGSAPSLLATSGYDPIDYVAELSPIPLLFIHGTDDRVIPIWHSQQLYDKAGEPRQFWVLNGGNHLEAFSRYLPQMGPKLLQFLDQALAAQSAANAAAETAAPETPATRTPIHRARPD